MIKIEMNRGSGKIDIKGRHEDVLAESVMVIVNLLEAFNNEDIRVIQELMTEIADEQI